MIINIANEALIYTAFCSYACANTAFQYLPIKSRIPWRDMLALNAEKLKQIWVSLCVSVFVSLNTGIR